MKRNYYQHAARIAAKRNDIASTMQAAYIAGYEQGFESAIKSLKELQFRMESPERDLDIWIHTWTNIMTDDEDWKGDYAH